MRLATSVALGLGLGLGGLACADFEIGSDAGLICEGEVDVPDEALRQLLLERLPFEDPDQDGQGSILGRHLILLEGLNAGGAGIENLKGLECAHGLRTLGLGSNEVASLEPLRGLRQLEELELSSNPLEDLSPLSELVFLKRLGLGDAGVDSLEALRPLVKLEHLELSDNGLRDIEVVAEFRELISLGLARNEVEDIGAVARLFKLEGMELHNNAIADLEALRGLVALRFLNLASNQFDDVGALSNLRALESLDLSNNQVRELAPLVELRVLIELRARENQLQNISGLENMDRLRLLELTQNQLTSLQGVQDLQALERLLVADNQLTQLAPVAGLPVLREIDARTNPELSDLGGLESLALLGVLSVGGNEDTRLDLSPISGAPLLSTLRVWKSGALAQSDFEALEPWPALTSLDLRDTLVEDAALAWLGALPNLQSLLVRHADIDDVGGLAGAVGLSRVDLLGNPLSDASGLSVLGTLLELERVELGSSDVSAVPWLADLERLSFAGLRDTQVDTLAPIIDNEFFRLGDEVDARGTALSSDDCADLETLVARDAFVQTDLSCD